MIKSNFWIYFFIYRERKTLRRNSLNNSTLRKSKFKNLFFSKLETSKTSENNFKNFKSLKKKKSFFYKISTFTHSRIYEPFTFQRNVSFKKNLFFEKKSIKNNSETKLSSYSINLFTSEILKKKTNELSFLILNFKENPNLFFSFNLCFFKTKPSKVGFDQLKWTEKEKLLTFCDSNASLNFRLANFNLIKVNPLPSENFVTSIKKKEMLNDTFFKRNAFTILNLKKIIQNYSTIYKFGSAKTNHPNLAKLSLEVQKNVSQYHLKKGSSKLIKPKLRLKICKPKPIFNKEISKNLEKNYRLSFFLKTTLFSFFTNYSIFIKNRKVRWQSSIPFLNQQIHRFLFFYQRICFFSETLLGSKKQNHLHLASLNFDISGKETKNWLCFYFEFKDQINSKDLRSLNLFLFNKFFDWSKNQHKNKPNSWIFKKYWLFVENNSTFSYTPVLSDSFEKVLRVKKAHKLEGYLCLKRFFSNFSDLNLTKLILDDSENQNQEKGKKKINPNKGETYSFKKKKLHLKTWYLKKYKKKKINLKTHKKNLCNPSFDDNFGFEKVCSYYIFGSAFQNHLNLANLSLGITNVKKIKLASFNYSGMRLLFLTKNVKSDSIGLFLKVNNFKLKTSHTFTKKYFLKKNFLEKFNLITKANLMIKNQTVWKENFLLFNFLDQYP